jgi:DNA-directed RNA polymerase specialized sigma24 family protein
LIRGADNTPLLVISLSCSPRARSRRVRRRRGSVGLQGYLRPGLASARARGVKLGRQLGHRPSDKAAKKVLFLHKEGLSYRLIGRNLGLSKNTVMEIVKREETRPS